MRRTGARAGSAKVAAGTGVAGAAAFAYFSTRQPRMWLVDAFITITAYGVDECRWCVEATTVCARRAGKGHAVVLPRLLCYLCMCVFGVLFVAI